MKEKVYPDWVQNQKPKGHSVKLVNGNYYLYEHKSVYVPGKKYPVPKDTYVGVITPDGIVYSKKRKLDLSDAVVREYGFSKTLLQLCPESWKKIQGDNWEDLLYALIVHESDNSYLQELHEVQNPSDLGVQTGTAMSSLIRKFNDENSVRFNEVKKLKTVFLITMGKKKFLSKFSEEHQKIISGLEINLEVN